MFHCGFEELVPGITFAEDGLHLPPSLPPFLVTFFRQCTFTSSVHVSIACFFIVHMLLLSVQAQHGRVKGNLE